MRINVTADVVAAERMLDNIEFGTAIPRTTINKAINQELTQARKKVVRAAKDSMKTDPLRARNAVVKTTYKHNVFGGLLTIKNPRRTGKMGMGTDAHWTRGGKSGTWRTRTVGKRTIQLRSYEGKDRAFILRFINAGTDTRRSKFGNRGSISGKNFFKPSSVQALEEASRNLGKRIEQIIIKASAKK